MVSTVCANLPLTATPAASDRVLADDDVAALFGLDMADPAAPSSGLAAAVGAADSSPRRQRVQGAS